MSNQEFFSRLCKLLCELDKLVKEHFFGKARECDTRCRLPKEG